jgi:hypothetical protein
MIVSIAIQRVRTREKLVRKFRENPITLSAINVMKNASGSNILAISDSRKPTKIKIVRNTSIKVWIAVLPRFL